MPRRGQGKVVSIPKSQWENWYINQSMTARQIAKMIGCKPCVVGENLRRHGIPIRSMSETQAIRWENYPSPRGPDHPSYKHGLNAGGYRQIYVGTYRNKKIRTEHRVVAEQCLGRPLTSTEVVHHRNEIKTDNRPINLWVFASQADHTNFHKNGTIPMNVIFPAAEITLRVAPDSYWLPPEFFQASFKA